MRLSAVPATIATINTKAMTGDHQESRKKTSSKMAMVASSSFSFL